MPYAQRSVRVSFQVGSDQTPFLGREPDRVVDLDLTAVNLRHP